jgi:transcriptional regulator with XRE-family HTH domain
MTLTLENVPAKRRTMKRSRPTMAEAGPHPVDIHVGSRIRLARLLSGHSQEWLADQVRLTFQQIQKYERGANRVSCSMLSEFAVALSRPIGWFFEEDPNESETVQTNDAIGGRQRLTYELTSSFSKIKNEKARTNLVGLVRAMAENSQTDA